MSASFPVRTTSSPHPAFLRKAEQREIQQPVRTSTGYITSILNTRTDSINWQSGGATGSTTAWNTLYGIFYTPTPGFALVIRSLHVTVDTNCLIGYQTGIQYGGTTLNLYGSSGSFTAKETIKNQVKWQRDMTGGEVIFSFPEDDPLIIRSDERLDISYSKTVSGAINTIVSVDGVEVVDDFNYNAPLTMLTMGDSISGVTNVAYAGEDAYWGHNIRNRYRAAGKDIRLVPIGITGTTMSDWDYRARMGRLNNLKADIVFINCGMNDSTFIGAGGTGVLSAGGAGIGADGKYKTGYKNVITTLTRLNKKLPIVINGVTPTDLTLAAGNLVNIRLEQQSLVTDMNALGYNLTYVDLSSVYSASDATKFIEQTVNTKLHPNDAGQKLIAQAIWTACQNLI